VTHSVPFMVHILLLPIPTLGYCFIIR